MQLDYTSEASTADRTGTAAGDVLPDPIERRQSPRIAFDAHVTLDSESCFTAGMAQNLSHGGIYVATLATPDIGDPVVVRVRVGDGEEPPMLLQGRVAWIRYDCSDEAIGCGIAFEDNDLAVMQRLQALIERLDRGGLLLDF